MPKEKRGTVARSIVADESLVANPIADSGVRRVVKAVASGAAAGLLLHA